LFVVIVVCADVMNELHNYSW